LRNLKRDGNMGKQAVDEHKRCQGSVAFNAAAVEGAARDALVIILQVFLERLKQGGRFDGFLDPADSGVGFLWFKIVYDKSGSPVASEFYMRKGGQRKLTESKRQKLEEALQAVGSAHGREDACRASVTLIDNDVGDDLIPTPLLEMRHEGEKQAAFVAQRDRRRRNRAVTSVTLCSISSCAGVHLHCLRELPCRDEPQQVANHRKRFAACLFHRVL